MARDCYRIIPFWISTTAVCPRVADVQRKHVHQEKSMDSITNGPTFVFPFDAILYTCSRNLKASRPVKSIALVCIRIDGKINEKRARRNCVWLCRKFAEKKKGHATRLAVYKSVRDPRENYWPPLITLLREKLCYADPLVVHRATING